jgi:hypothetical protein
VLQPDLGICSRIASSDQFPGANQLNLHGFSEGFTVQFDFRDLRAAGDQARIWAFADIFAVLA